MTPARVIALVVSSWVLLVSCGALLTVCADAWGNHETANALGHSTWMFVVCGGLLGAAGLVVWMAVALINEVRTARVLGTVTAPGGCMGENPVGSGAVRRVRGEW